ncbi:putative metal-nicotianamine transporter YSL7 [Morella rubra]|uniref:Putative metal-nicotianamine transporter YSL7 n=1 Tax=Morella rubra TaxID=262757 RepID=A0A6A1VH34_9ROSI|nr:putative metal-nicotianamine transporter YSL7 [Morella rubra]
METDGELKKDKITLNREALNMSAEEDKNTRKPVLEESAAEKEDSKEYSSSIEEIFSSKEVPSWQKQLTLRAFVVSFVLSVLFAFIVMKLNLTTGIIPSLNVSAGLLGFFFIKTWTKFLEKSGMLRQPFTRQENTVIQTCVVASSGIAFSACGVGKWYADRCLWIPQQMLGPVQTSGLWTNYSGVNTRLWVGYGGRSRGHRPFRIVLFDCGCGCGCGVLELISLAHSINYHHFTEFERAGGFGNYLFGMSEAVAKQSLEANDAENVKNPAIGWMIAFLFVVSFIGLFSVVPLRKIMVVDFKLIYPSGTATAHLINSFHTPQGAKLAKKQVRELGKFFSFSFLWGFFQWFFTAGDSCGFKEFPTFGLKAHENQCQKGLLVLCRAQAKQPTWPARLQGNSSFHVQKPKIFIAIAMILGDGLYNFFKVLGCTLFGLYRQLLSRDLGTDVLPSSGRSSPVITPSLSYDDQRRTRLFLKDQIPTWFAITGYVTIAIISTATLPHIFPQLKWYYAVVIYIIAPPLAFCNAYGTGLTDWSLGSTYGKLAIFTIGAWAGASHGGVLQDFKTGYLTLASPKSMFVSQIIGTAMGCIISPCVFWLFYKAYSDLGVPGSEYSAPYALVYRNMAILGVEGFSALRSTASHFAMLSSLELSSSTVSEMQWGGSGLALFQFPWQWQYPFILDPYFTIDMC